MPVNYEILFPQNIFGRHQRQDNNPTFVFTFSPPFNNEREAFDTMASGIRMVLQNYFHITDLDQNFPIHYQFNILDQPFSYARDRLANSISQITGEALSNVFDAVLQSNQTIDIYSIQISVKSIGLNLSSVNRSGRGLSGKKCGVGIPIEIKKIYPGLGDHPSVIIPAVKQTIDQIGLCGILASLLGLNFQLYEKDHERWIDDAKEIASLIQITDGNIRYTDFDEIVKLPLFCQKRIFIYGPTRYKEYHATGSQWNFCPSEKSDDPRKSMDVNTISLLFLEKESHYFWIQNIRAFYKNTFGKRNTFCGYCLKFHSTTKFQEHLCDIEEIEQCNICKQFFTDEESMNYHNDQINTNYKCHICNKSTFRGQECFNKHLYTNCSIQMNPKDKKKVRLICEECDDTYIVDGKKHICGDYGGCFKCEVTFANRLQRIHHRCYLKKDKTAIWKPITKVKNSNSYVGKMHLFYDFETCRGEQMGENQYRHEVMAWCIKSILLGEKDDYILKAIFKRIHQKIMDEKSFFFRYIESQILPDGNIRVYGRTIDKFDHICHYFKVDNIKPIFWAHNGSKFDVKFILDYYINIKKFDLAGSRYEFEYMGPVVNEKTTKVEWKEITWSGKRANVITICNVGSKILALTLNQITFKCSLAHFSRPLRDLPAMFGFDKDVRKGEFPYIRLSHRAWGSVHHNGLPPIEEYNVDSLSGRRRKEIIDWWFEEQQRRNAKLDQDLLDKYGKTNVYDESDITIAWDFDGELKAYLFADVDVGAEAMRQYHYKAKEMQNELKDFVSPLDSTTAPGWALKIFKTHFLKDNLVVNLKNEEAQFIRESLHGGRTDKRANIIKISDERLAAGDRIIYCDFTSHYPAVQKVNTHGTHFPVHIPNFMNISPEREMNNQEFIRIVEDSHQTGFCKIDCKIVKYTTHPTLCVIGTPTGKNEEKKLLFSNQDIQEQIYAIPEILEAIRCGEIEVTKVHKFLLFSKGDVFGDYVDFFFKVKDNATQTGNEGLRSLSKLLLNSLWGKLGQRAYATKEWVSYRERLKFLTDKFNSGEYILKKCESKDNGKIWIEYEKEDKTGDLSQTAYHVAAFVSMWGRVVLHREILSKHGQRALYCDTDSAIIYLRANDELGQCGNLETGLGGLTDECEKILKDAGYSAEDRKGAFIREAVFVAPKTYALHIQSPRVEAYYKVVCKGFELSYNNSQKITFQVMKDLVKTNYNIYDENEEHRPLKRVKTEKYTTFVSSTERNMMSPVETIMEKTLTGQYTKGKVNPLDNRLIVPYGDLHPTETFLDFIDDNKHYP